MCGEASRPRPRPGGTHAAGVPDRPTRARGPATRRRRHRRRPPRGRAAGGRAGGREARAGGAGGRVDAHAHGGEATRAGERATEGPEEGRGWRPARARAATAGRGAGAGDRRSPPTVGPPRGRRLDSRAPRPETTPPSLPPSLNSSLPPAERRPVARPSRAPRGQRATADGTAASRGPPPGHATLGRVPARAPALAARRGGAEEGRRVGGGPSPPHPSPDGTDARPGKEARRHRPGRRRGRTGDPGTAPPHRGGGAGDGPALPNPHLRPTRGRAGSLAERATPALPTPHAPRGGSLSRAAATPSRPARGRRRGSRQGLHLGGRRTRGDGGPCEETPSRATPGATTPGGRLIVKRRSDRRSPGRNPGPQVRSKCR